MSYYIIPLAINFPTLVDEADLDNLEEQWRELPSAKNSIEDISHGSDVNIPLFWNRLHLVTDENNSPKLRLLSKFMCQMLVSPHSSACVERVFSQVNMIKTPQTNRLLADTVAIRLLATQAISRQGSQCHTWTPSASLTGDVAEGRCHQRNEQKRLQSNEQNVVTTHDIVFDSVDDTTDSN